MRKVCVFILLFVFVVNAYSSPFSKLIYKKDFALSGDIVNTDRVNVSAFHTIRISLVSDSDREIEGEIKLNDGSDEAGSLGSFRFKRTHTVVIEAPSTQISLALKGSGKVKVYMWGS